LDSLPGLWRRGFLAWIPGPARGNRGIAAKYPGDKGIESDPAVLFHDDFESGDIRGKWDNYYQAADTRITEEPANVNGGKRALEFIIPKQTAELSDGVVNSLGSGQDVVFLRYYSKFEKGFDQTGLKPQRGPP
jgi:hypothetical protein